GHWNFSENTSLSETLIVAQKLKEGNQPKGNVTFVNLWRNPRNTVDALALTRSIQRCSATDIHDLRGPANLSVGSAKFGEAVRVRQPDLKGSIWSFPCSYAQSELLRTFYALRSYVLVLPGHKEKHGIP